MKSTWEIERQWTKEPTPEAIESPKDFTVDATIVREGIDWVNPHITRVFWDNAQPLANLNYDTGPEWIGFWDVKRYSEVKNNLCEKYGFQADLKHMMIGGLCADCRK